MNTYYKRKPLLSRDVAAVGSARAVPRLVELLEEGLLHGLLEGDPLPGLVPQHHPDQLEHLGPVLTAPVLAGNVTGQGFALPPHVPASRTLLVPLEFALGEIFEFRSLRHLWGNCAENPLHHSQVLLENQPIRV